MNKPRLTMERPSLSSPLRAFGALLRGATMTLLFSIIALSVQSQTGAQWSNDVHVNGPFIANGFGILDTHGGPGGLGFQYQCVGADQAWGQNYGGVETYYTLPAGPGQQEFIASIRYDTRQGAYEGEPWFLYVDGQLATSYTATTITVVQSSYYDQGGTNRYYNDVRVRVRHTLGANWPSGIREFGLGVDHQGAHGTLAENTQVRFKAVMVGTTFTNVLGYYNAPALPLYILRDPPGDGSYSSITSASDICSGSSTSVTTGDSQNGYFKARIGVSGSIGFIASINYEIYGEIGVDMSASQSETSSNEYQTCLSTNSTFNTPMTGPPQDVFIGSAVRYAYGMGFTIARPNLTTINATSQLATAPVATQMSYNYTEGTIRNTIIPQLITQIDGMAAGPDRDRALTQLDVWYQTLAMNDSIKANAPYEVVRNFDGGGNGQDFALSASNSESYAINYEAQLEAGLSFEFGVNIGGSGITTGGAAKFQNGYGRGTSGSNVSTNTVQYHLEDANSDDHFAVQVFRDEVFGTYVFQLDSTGSETSCPYEGGYQIDQPVLSVGTPGNTRMVVNEAPVGAGIPVNFPLYICNDSNYELTYNIKVRGGTNTEGGVVVVLGENISSDILGQECEAVPANGCYDVTNLTLTDPNPFDEITDFEIEVYLYSPCEPSMRSSVILEAHFGPGNFGSYCTPISEEAGTVGDHINGVQLGNIDNTGTGATPMPGYVNYSDQFSTPLSRNAQRVLSITSGHQVGTQYTAFIDYDRDNIFEDGERIGSFTSSLPGEVGNLAFTVPNNALIGSTILRVRAVREDGVSISMIDACYSHTYGETEDYAVVINGNTPQDCAGVNNGGALPGTPCNDNNADTGNDTWNANCQCVGLLIDCAGTPGGNVHAGSPCNDNDADTGGDVYNANCACVGQPYDCTGIPGGTATVGTPCNDNNGATGNDRYNADCQCVGQPFDCLGIPGGATVPGTLCNDNNPATSGDVFTANCICAGTLAEDCAGVAGGTAQPGTPCDDGNANTGNDVYGNDCNCAGLALDCAGVPGGPAAPGTPCDDGSVLTDDDMYNAECTCLGTAPNDCEGVAGGSAQPGTPCDDGNANTGNDMYSVFCQCEGQLMDCEGSPGGMALPGVPCDDGIAGTLNDAYTLGCECEGQLPTTIADANGTSISFTVQPNPSTGIFTFNNPAQKATRVEVRDAIGRLVMQPMVVGTSRASTIDLSGLASGTYHLVAEAEGHRQVIQIMVQR